MESSALCVIGTVASSGDKNDPTFLFSGSLAEKTFPCGASLVWEFRLGEGGRLHGMGLMGDSGKAGSQAVHTEGEEQWAFWRDICETFLITGHIGS